jgi:hypothetical protein
MNNLILQGVPQVIKVFQLDAELGMLKEKQPSQAFKKATNRWVKTKSKIKVDPNLGVDKIK